MIFYGQNAIFVFYTTCIWNKNLCCGLVRDKNVGFCHIIYPKTCSVSETILQLNTIQLKLPYIVPYFLVDQTHPICIKV